MHSDTLSVYDVSYWKHHHHGNKVAEQYNRANPIAAFAERGGVALAFPSHHLMKQWSENKKYHAYLGRLDDVVDFRELPTAAQHPAMAALLDASATSGRHADADAAGGGAPVGAP